MRATTLMLVTDEVDVKQETNDGYGNMVQKGQPNHRLRRATLEGRLHVRLVNAGDNAAPNEKHGEDFSNDHVDGEGDLRDFFPVCLSVGDLLESFPAAEGYEYKLSHADECLNFAYADLTRQTAFDYLAQKTNTGFGPDFRQPPHSASVQKITKEGVALSSAFISRLQARNGDGVLIMEGRFGMTNRPLVLSVGRGNIQVARFELPLFLLPMRVMDQGTANDAVPYEAGVLAKKHRADSLWLHADPASESATISISLDESFFVYFGEVRWRVIDAENNDLIVTGVISTAGQQCSITLRKTGWLIEGNPLYAVNLYRNTHVQWAQAAANAIGDPRLNSATLLALWQKEGSLKALPLAGYDASMRTHPTGGDILRNPATVDEAKIYYINHLAYSCLGSDYLTIYTRSPDDRDNILDLRDYNKSMRHFIDNADKIGGAGTASRILGMLTDNPVRAIFLCRCHE